MARTTKWQIGMAVATALLAGQARAALVTPTGSGYLNAGQATAYPLGTPSNGSFGNSYNAKTYINITEAVASTNDAYTLGIQLRSGTGIESFDNFSSITYVLTFTPASVCSFEIASTYAEVGKSNAFTKYYLTEYPTGISYAYQYQSSAAANFVTTLPTTTGQLRAGYMYKLGIEIQNAIPKPSTGYTDTTATAAFQFSLTTTPDPATVAMLVPAALLMRRSKCRGRVER